MEKKYLVIGGKVKSRSDGDIHYVNAAQLARLYHVYPAECIFEEEKYPEPIGVARSRRTDLIVLRPREDGNYGVIYGK